MLKYSVPYTSIERVCHTLVWKALCLTIKSAGRQTSGLGFHQNLLVYKMALRDSILLCPTNKRLRNAIPFLPAGDRLLVGLLSMVSHFSIRFPEKPIE
jgi:hypothetical protein